MRNPLATIPLTRQASQRIALSTHSYNSSCGCDECIDLPLAADELAPAPNKRTQIPLAMKAHVHQGHQRRAPSTHSYESECSCSECVYLPLSSDVSIPHPRKHMFAREMHYGLRGTPDIHARAEDEQEAGLRVRNPSNEETNPSSMNSFCLYRCIVEQNEVSFPTDYSPAVQMNREYHGIPIEEITPSSLEQIMRRDEEERDVFLCTVIPKKDSKRRRFRRWVRKHIWKRAPEKKALKISGPMPVRRSIEPSIPRPRYRPSSDIVKRRWTWMFNRAPAPVRVIGCGEGPYVSYLRGGEGMDGDDSDSEDELSNGSLTHESNEPCECGWCSNLTPEISAELGAHALEISSQNQSAQTSGVRQQQDVAGDEMGEAINVFYATSFEEVMRLDHVQREEMTTCLAAERGSIAEDEFVEYGDEKRGKERRRWAFCINALRVKARERYRSLVCFRRLDPGACSR